MNNVEIEQVAKLLGVTLDCKLSWSKHVDTTFARICCAAFLTALSTRQVLEALVLSHLDYSSVMLSGATKRDLGTLQLTQNRAARLALGCTQSANINNMCASSSNRQLGAFNMTHLS